MRKYIIGFLAGAFLTLTTSVYGAEVANLIGKKVQGEVSVSVDGTGIGKAVVIDGTSYAPVRAIGESAGYEVSIEGKEVNLKSSVTTAQTPGDVKMNAAQIQTVLTQKIKERTSLQNRIKQWESAIADPKYAKNVDSLTITLNANKASLEKTEQRIAELEAQLAELQGQ